MSNKAWCRQSFAGRITPPFGTDGLNSRGAHEPTHGRVFYGASICPIFGIARPRTRHLHALHTRAIVQPSGSMCPFRLRAWSSPCVRIRRLGAEILPMEPRRTSPNGADPIQRSSPRQLGCSSIYIKKTWCDAATRPSEAIRYGSGGWRVVMTRWRRHGNGKGGSPFAGAGPAHNEVAGLRFRHLQVAE
jgi:hypothetical protein